MDIMKNDSNIPIVGFGTLNLNGKDGIEAIINAIKLGYRHIDTAQTYNTEYEVGKAVRYCIDNNIVQRKDLFITSKIDPHRPIGYNEAINAVNSSLEIMGLDYLDLYLIHYPNIAPGSEWKKLNRLTYEGLEECVNNKKLKNIGVSNFMTHHLDELLKTAKIHPLVNQIHLSPIWQQKELVDYCNKKNIICCAWSPRVRPFDIVENILGRKVYGEIEDLNNIILNEISKKYDKSSTQITIKWCLQKGFIPIVKTSDKQRMIENLNVFDFVLDKQDIQKLDSLNSRPVFPDVAPDISYTIWAYQQKLQEKTIDKKWMLKFLGLQILTYMRKSEFESNYCLFGFIPLIKTKTDKNKTKYYLFNFIPILKKVHKNDQKYKYYLFNLIQLFTLKIKKETINTGIELVPNYLK